MKFLFAILALTFCGCATGYYHEDYPSGQYVYIDHHWAWRTRHADGTYGGWEYRHHDPTPPHVR